MHLLTHSFDFEHSRARGHHKDVNRHELGVAWRLQAQIAFERNSLGIHTAKAKQHNDLNDKIAANELHIECVNVVQLQLQSSV